MADGMGIPHSGKDLITKTLANTYGEKSFKVYGLDLPKIKAYLPTELPAISGNDRFADHIFEFEDGTYGIVDYESKYLESNKVKYLEYATRLIKKYFAPGQKIGIRIIVIYTCDVESASDVLDAGAVKLTIEQAFLTHIDGEVEYQKISAKVKAHDELDDEDLMRLIILPLTVKGNEGKQKMIDKVIETGELLRDYDKKDSAFVLSAMAIAAGNFLTQEQKNRLVEVMRMTEIGQMFIDRVEKEKDEKTARRMIRAGLPNEMIVDCTDLSRDDVERLREKTIKDLATV